MSRFWEMHPRNWYLKKLATPVRINTCLRGRSHKRDRRWGKQQERGQHLKTEPGASSVCQQCSRFRQDFFSCLTTSDFVFFVLDHFELRENMSKCGVKCRTVNISQKPKCFRAFLSCPWTQDNNKPLWPPKRVSIHFIPVQQNFNLFGHNLFMTVRTTYESETWKKGDFLNMNSFG